MTALAPASSVAALWLALAGARLTNTVTLGSLIIGGAVGLATLVGVFFGVRYKTAWRASSAANDELRKELADERRRHEQASGERRELAGRVAQLERDNAELKALPNLAAILEQMAAEATRIDAVGRERFREGLEAVREMSATLMEAHEAAAAARHAELLSGNERLAGLLDSLVRGLVARQ